MTLDDLLDEFKRAVERQPFSGKLGYDARLEGIRAVVEALRDEFWMQYGLRAGFDEILASDGVDKAAGGNVTNPSEGRVIAPAADLVKRLREYCSIDKGADPLMLKVLSVVRPDLSGAADRIEALEGEVARLRAALEEIASGRYSGLLLMSNPPQDPAVRRAREALSTSGSDASASPEGCDTDQLPSDIAPRPAGKT